MNRLGVPYVELTNKCNLRCVYCYNESDSKYNKYLEIDVYSKLLNELEKSNINSIVISGGEPFLHHDILEILNMTFQRKIKPLIITNATIVHSEIIKCICDQECNVQVTFDDMLPSLHDRNRGKDTFKKNMEFIMLLRQNNFKGKILVRAHIRESNANKFGEYMSFLAQLPIDRIDLASIKEMGRAKQSFNGLSYCGIIDIFKYVTKNIFQIPVNINGVFCGLDEGCPFNSTKDVFFQPRITPNGDVFPCQLFEDSAFCIGNIHKNSLMEIISSDKSVKFIEHIRERQRVLGENSCKLCIVNKWCNKGCAAKCWQDHANFLHVDGSCAVKKFHYKEQLKHHNNMHRRGI